MSETKQTSSRSGPAWRSDLELARQYLDPAEVILLTVDLEEQIALVIQKDCSLLGWKEHQLLGRGWIDTCLPARIRHALRELFHNVLMGGRSYFDRPVLAKSGEERVIGYLNVLVRGCRGRALSPAQDITEHSRPEAKLRAYQRAVEEGDERIVVVAGVAEYRAISAVLVPISDRAGRSG